MLAQIYDNILNNASITRKNVANYIITKIIACPIYGYPTIIYKYV
jgi:hypothetical protein